jgi:hypothetical protein
LDSGTSQVIGSIDQVAALNAALGGAPAMKQLPFNCGKHVAAVLANTAQALTGSDPNAAANQVRTWLERCHVGHMLHTVAQRCREGGNSNRSTRTVVQPAKQAQQCRC